MNTTASFAILDVKRGRVKLRNLVEDHKHKIPVTITGNIVGVWSGDDTMLIRLPHTNDETH